MRKYKKTLTVSIILIVALIMFASFFGVYVKNKEGVKTNLIPNYKLGMQFGQKRVISATVNDEVNETIYDSEGKVVTPEEGVEYTEEKGYKIEQVKVNDDSIRTVENYKKAKKIIDERLKNTNVTEYNVTLDETTGKIKIEIPEDSNADSVQAIIENSGSFMLLDSETFEVVLDSNSLKEANVMYSQGDLETAIFLQLEFNEEGTKKLQELNSIYVEKQEEKTNENGETETVTTSKQVWVLLNDTFLGQTVLPNIVHENKIMLTYGISSDSSEIENASRDATDDAILLNSGTSEILYNYSNEIQETKISEEKSIISVMAIGVVFLIAYICLVIKFKAKGFIATYFQIGFLAVLLLVLRFTNVTLTVEGIAGIIIALVLEYIFTYIVLDNMKEKVEGMYKKANLEFFFNTLPTYIISVVFTFGAKANISSFGMTLFWGIILIYVYNFIFSKFIFENLSREAKNENN